MSQPMSKMVIVNGQIQRQGTSSTPPADGSSGDSMLSGTMTVCGLAFPRWSIGAFLFMALLLGGLKGLLVVLFVAGAATFFSAATTTTPSTMSSAPRRGGGLSNVRGMGDLPKTVQKGG